MNKLSDFTKRYKEMSPAVKNSLWFTLCNYLQKATALITVPIFTRLLTTEQYGVCNVYFAWFEIFIIFTSLQLPYEGLNNGFIRHEEEKDHYVSAIAGLILTLSCAIVLILLPFQHKLFEITGLNQILFLLLMVHLCCNPGLMLWINRRRFDFDYRIPVIVTLLSTVLSPLISITLVLTTEYKAEARVSGTVIVQVIFGIVCYAVLFKKGKCFYQKSYWKFALGFNLPLLMYYLSQSLLNQADRVMINYFIGKTEAGIYSVAYTAASLMLLAVSAVNGSFNPWMYRKIKQQEYQAIKKVVIALCLLMAIATVGMTAFAPDIIKLLATQEYMQAMWIIPPVSASVFFIFLYMIFANVEMYHGENGPISFISIIASVINIGLNAYFVPRFGYIAAGWTTLFSYVSLTLMHYYFMRRTLKIHQVQRFLPEQFLFIVSIIVMLMSLFFVWIYQFGALRYVIILFELLLAWIMRKKLINIYQNIKEKV